MNDFGTYYLNHGDDYPDFVIPLDQAVAAWPRTLAPRIHGLQITALIRHSSPSQLPSIFRGYPAFLA